MKEYIVFFDKDMQRNATIKADSWGLDGGRVCFIRDKSTYMAINEGCWSLICEKEQEEDKKEEETPLI